MPTKDTDRRRRASIESSNSLIKLLRKQKIRPSPDRKSPGKAKGLVQSVNDDDDELVGIEDLGNSMVIQPKETELSIQEKRSILDQIGIFKILNEPQRDAVFRKMKTLHYQNNDKIIKQNTMGRHFYILSSGTCDVVKESINGIGIVSQETVAIMSRGMYFGEVALLVSAPRMASVIATGPVTCLALAKEDFEENMNQCAVRMRKEKGHLMDSSIMENITFFKQLSKLEKANIMKLMKTITFDPGHYICKQGDVGDIFYVILSGKIRVFKTIQSDGLDDEEMELATLQTHDYFGEMALMNPDCVRTAHCVAITDVTCMFLHRSHLNAVPRLLDLMGIQSVTERYGGVLVEEHQEIYADYVTEPEVQEKKSLGLANLTSLMMGSVVVGKRTTEKAKPKGLKGFGTSAPKGNKLFTKMQRAKFKIREMGHKKVQAMKATIYARLFEKAHSHPEILNHFFSIAKTIDFLDRRAGSLSIRDVCHKILYSAPCSRTKEEVFFLYTMIKDLKFWSVLCKDASNGAKLRLCQSMKLYKMYDQSGPCVYQRGDLANSIYILLQGKLIVSEDEDDDGQNPAECAVRLSPGSCFGMLAAINEMQPTRTEMVRIPEVSPKLCLLKPECIVVSVESYRREIEGEIDLSKALTVSQIYDVLQSTPPFSTTYDWFTTYKASVFFRSKIFPKGSVLCHQGHASESFFVIVSGTVRIMHDRSSLYRTSVDLKDPLGLQNLLKRSDCLSLLGLNECLGQSAIFSHCDPSWMKEEPRNRNDYVESSMAVCSTEVMCLALKRTCIRKLGTACMSELKKIHRSRNLFHEQRLEDLKSNRFTKLMMTTKTESIGDVFVECEKSPGMLMSLTKEKNDGTRSKPNSTPTLDPIEKPIVLGQVIGEEDPKPHARAAKTTWQTPFGSSRKPQNSRLRETRLIGKGKHSRYMKRRKAPSGTLPVLSQEAKEEEVDRHAIAAESNEAQQSRIKGIMSALM